MTWLSDGFRHPERVELPTGHHLRPIREADVDIDYPAVMSSREWLWAKYGEAWGWPPATMSSEADREDLAHDGFVPRWLADTWGLRSVDYHPKPAERVSPGRTRPHS